MINAVRPEIVTLRSALDDAFNLEVDVIEVNKRIAKAWQRLHTIEIVGERVVGVNFALERLTTLRRKTASWVVLQASDSAKPVVFPDQPAASIDHPVLAAPSRSPTDLIVPCLMDPTENEMYGFSLPLINSQSGLVTIGDEIKFKVFERPMAEV